MGQTRSKRCCALLMGSRAANHIMTFLKKVSLSKENIPVWLSWQRCLKQWDLLSNSKVEEYSLEFIGKWRLMNSSFFFCCCLIFLSLSICSFFCVCVCVTGKLVASGQYRVQCSWPAGSAAAGQGTTLITVSLPAPPVCHAPPCVAL